MITLPNKTLTLNKYKKYTVFILFVQMYINLKIECEIIAI